MGNIDSMIFQPSQIEYTVEDLKEGIEDEIEVHFTNKKVCFCIIYPKIAKVMKKYVVWSYGNACDMLSMKEYAVNFANKYQIAIVLYDYIGYGLSRDNRKPTEQNCYDSLDSVISYLQNRDIEIILVGHSLGTGIVVDYVSKNIYWDMPIVLISPYKSIVSIRFDTSFKYYLFSYFNRFNSYSKINKVFCPVKIFHGIDDSLINVSHSNALYSLLRDTTYLPTFFANVGHNDILQHIDFSSILI